MRKLLSIYHLKNSLTNQILAESCRYKKYAVIDSSQIDVVFSGSSDSEAEDIEMDQHSENENEWEEEDEDSEGDEEQVENNVESDSDSAMSE